MESKGVQWSRIRFDLVQGPVKSRLKMSLIVIENSWISTNRCLAGLYGTVLGSLAAVGLDRRSLGFWKGYEMNLILLPIFLLLKLNSPYQFFLLLFHSFDEFD